ncbi:MAG TPA: ribosome maturation factor RimP [Bdellovibrionota bacterium]|jgi:ribosome maturation factor RimP|nr:ribosome maturation factor RimP [Bdellovibrionota bacterium]
MNPARAHGHPEERNPEAAALAHAAESRLTELLTPVLDPLGYDVVAVEVLAGRQRKLRVFIDRKRGQGGIGIEDCVTASRAVDPVLETSPEVDAIFKGAYELEVSSPGSERPLRTPADFERFSGHRARVHLLRPLTGEESGNASYQEKNPRQKNYLGLLEGFRDGAVLLRVKPESGPDPKAIKGRKPKRKPATDAAGEQVRIPLVLVSKAHLEPEMELDLEDDERKK